MMNGRDRMIEAGRVGGAPPPPAAARSTTAGGNSVGHHCVHVSRLYPEILALVFSYLSTRDKGRSSQVCAAWRDAAYHRSVWRGAEAKLHLRRSNPSLFPSLVRRGIRRVQVLSMRRSLRDVVHGISTLESLNLCGCYNVTDVGLLHAFVQQLPHLTVLNLSLCKQITDESIARIAQYLTNLDTLELGGCTNLTNTALLLIAWGLKKLKTLNLRSCRHISDSGIGHLAGQKSETSTGSPANDSVGGGGGSTAAVAAAAAASAATATGGANNFGASLELECLGLQDCQKLTDEALRNLSVGLQSLKKINLSFCAGVTDSGLKHLARMAHLRELNLRSCDNISDTGLAYLAEGGSRVTALDVSFCDKIGDAGLVHVSQGLFQLRSLSLNACPVSDEGVGRVSRNLHELDTLNIGQCNRVTDKSLASIADHLTNLRCIDLYGCVKITTVGLERIMQLPNLSVLNLGLWHKR